VELVGCGCLAPQFVGTQETLDILLQVRLLACVRNRMDQAVPTDCKGLLDAGSRRQYPSMGRYFGSLAPGASASRFKITIFATARIGQSKIKKDFD
jgi:hypothetical protein